MFNTHKKNQINNNYNITMRDLKLLSSTDMVID